MKKIIIAFVLVLILTSVFCICASADGTSTATPSVKTISISSYPDKTVYGAFEQLDTTGLSLRASYADGSERIISGSDIRVSYNRDNCFRVGDDSVLLSYGGKSLYLPVTVNRIAYDISTLQLEDFSVVYNGAFQTYNRPLPQIIGLDGIPLGINLSGGGIGVGIYDISVDFHSESKDYFTPESRVVCMTVKPAAAQVVWEGSSFVYDGKSKSPVAYYTDVSGSKVYLTVSGAATNAGTGYVARAATSDLNYEFTNTICSYEIRKADFDFSSVAWSKDSFIYDGSKKSISASGLPVGVSIIGYSGDRGSDAGAYTVTAMLRWDESNYNPPPALTHAWEIKKADYDTSSFSFRSESYTYDGKMHYPTLIGNMPTGADGISLEYSFSSGACHVADGKISVVISFHTASKNYNVPENRYSSVVITPLGITVDWENIALTYNGDMQYPSAFAEECAVVVSGGAVNAGKYIATATTENTDYFIANDKIEYTIAKATNFWTVTPTDSVCYEGKEIILSGAGKFGEIRIDYYADKDAMQKISAPTACGKYYAILVVPETENYSGLVSEVISFEIVKVVAISFVAEITKNDIKAFDKLSFGDFNCSVVNNDGSISVIEPSLVAVIYENGNSFRRTDEWVRLEYGEFVLTLSVSVGYADYDLSGVNWVNSTQTYDGSPKTPTLQGLPKGVRVSEYMGANQINAGSYKVYATLEYDEENYNEPTVPYCEFIITKCPVNAPIISYVYNGKGQTPLSDSPLYTIKSAGEYTDAGEYPILAELNDPSNYMFVNGSGEQAYGIFEILPATLSVSVKDVRLKLFEELSEVDYIITAGTLYGNDILLVTPYAEGKRALIRSDNPNYRFEVTSGRIIRLPYPTFRGAFMIFSFLLMAFAIVLAVVAGIRNRHRIIAAAAMLKCRWHNRKYKAPMPRIDDLPEEAEDIGIADSFDKEIESLDATITDGVDMDEADDVVEADESADLAIIDFEIDAERADKLITDSLAKSLINREGEIIYTDGSDKEIINVGLLSKNFTAGERVDVNSLKRKGLVAPETAYIKVLGGGSIDKPLMVYANDFSLSAVKMIALTGGQVIKVVTFKNRSKDEKD